VLSNGTMLIGNMPSVGPRAYLHQVYPPLGESEIIELSGALQKNIPDDYREFLSMANGINIFSDSLALYGFRHNYSREGDDVYQPYHLDVINNKERIRDSKETYFYIGSYNYDGSRLYIDITDGKVHRCDRRKSISLNAWANFGEMIEKEVLRIQLLYTPAGLRKDPSIPTVPS
jgi:hypothetical protein